jgi:hypothetical protein
MGNTIGAVARDAFAQGTLGTVFADYVGELRAAWAEEDIPERADRCRRAMEHLLASKEGAWISAMDEVAVAERPVELYRDGGAGFIQKAHPYRPGHATSPHGHGPGAWVVYGVQRGQVEMATYEETGGEPPLRTVASEVLEAGRACVYLPGDMHSTRAVTGASDGAVTAVVLRLLSEDLSRLKRPRYGWQDVAVPR